MKVIFIDPILAIQGKISSDYYCRRLANGKNVIQKKPDRSNHVKTQREADNQKRFAERFAGRSAERFAERSAGKTSTSPSQRVYKNCL